MPILATQSPTIKRILHDPARGRVALVSASGCDIYSITDWVRVAWVALANVTCGAINQNGLYLGTSDTGVHRLPLNVTGAATSALAKVFNSGLVILDNLGISDMQGVGEALTIVTSSPTLYYLPDLVTAYRYTGTDTPQAVAINAGYIGWASADATRLLTRPVADWSIHETSFGIGATRLQFEDETNNLLICRPAGLVVVNVENPGGDEVPESFSSNFDEYPLGTPSGLTSRWQTGGALNIVDVSGDKLLRLTHSANGYSAYSFDALTATEGWDGLVSLVCADTSKAPRLLVRGSGGGASRTGLVLILNSGNLTLGQYVADTFTTITTYSRTMSSGVKYWIEFQVSGAAGSLLIKVRQWADGQSVPDWQIDTTSTANIGSGWFGIGSYTSGTQTDIHSVEITTDVMVGGGSPGVDLTGQIGTVTTCTDAVMRGGKLAYATSNGSDGGRFGLLDVTDLEAPTSITTVDGDGSAVWIDDTLTAAIHDNELERYRLVAEISPAANAANVRRDWTLYAEITDALGGIATGTVALTVNGVSQTPTVSAITDGFAVTFTTAGNSGYAERVTIVISGTDADGNTVSRSWTFTTVTAPALTASDAAPPNVVCIRDINLTAAESDETIDSINVVWLDTHTSPLIVTEAQAKEVGRVKIDETTYHKHKVGVRVLATDSNDLQTRDLRPGSIAAITCNALGMTAQKCEILAIQRTIRAGDDEDISFDIQAAYYEEV